jgi:hypothetical protein
MEFNVLLYDVNKNKVVHYNVISYFIDCWNDKFHKEEKKEIKKTKSKDLLKEYIINMSRYMYWARCQYEFLIAPWPFGSKRIKDDMTEFLKKDIDLNNVDDDIMFYNIILQDMYKIDIHEQIMMNIDILVDILYKEFKI